MGKTQNNTPFSQFWILLSVWEPFVLIFKEPESFSTFELRSRSLCSFTILCFSIGYIIVLRRELVSLRGEKRQASWGSTLMHVLDVLKKGTEKFGKKKNPKQEAAEEETATDDESVVGSPHSKYQRYMNCGMSEVSDRTCGTCGTMESRAPAIHQVTIEDTLTTTCTRSCVRPMSSWRDADVVWKLNTMQRQMPMT